MKPAAPDSRAFFTVSSPQITAGDQDFGKGVERQQFLQAPVSADARHAQIQNGQIDRFFPAGMKLKRFFATGGGQDRIAETLKHL